MSQSPSIIYTLTDEAPALATRSLLPIFRAFLGAAGVELELRDISVAARILAAFPDRLKEEQRVPDSLAELGELAQTPAANIIKLPNVSASVPQLTEAIAELQDKGFDIPDYPEEPNSDEAREIKARYDKIKGSAVNPVLREGNSDRRAPKAVKQHAKANPPPMKDWSPDSKTHVATMSEGDFRSNEKSVTLDAATTVRIEHRANDGTVTILKDGLSLEAGEILDATRMSRSALTAFLEKQIADARDSGLLFSLHLKATMMKVSDPILFGHAVRTYFKSVFEKHGQALEEIGVDPNNGVGDMMARLGELPEERKAAVEADVEAALAAGPGLAMVNSAKGITNLHVPSDIIIDASMPPMIRDGGRMWNANDELQDTKAVIPDSSYAGVYQTVVSFCQENGALDPSTMGSVSNVGLMAKKAEEYGSHDKTFEVSGDGKISVLNSAGETLIEHDVEAGDIWRACQTKDAPVKDWVRLAVRRARATGVPALFWLDRERAHDCRIIEKVESELSEIDTEGVDIRILSPVEATRLSLERIVEGKDTISVTGNVLRDYLTDLFPILEVGTSAKMLSIVPLMNGGGLFETGAGGSAPKHVQQFTKEGHLRWDSLGEFLAMAASLEHLSESADLPVARLLSDTLDAATSRVLAEGNSPSRKCGENDNRGSHFYLALYWAEALAEGEGHDDVRARFARFAEALRGAEAAITEELLEAQGPAVELGGYYLLDEELATAAMRPSATLNDVLKQI